MVSGLPLNSAFFYLNGQSASHLTYHSLNSFTHGVDTHVHVNQEELRVQCLAPGDRTTKPETGFSCLFLSKLVLIEKHLSHKCSI